MARDKPVVIHGDSKLIVDFIVGTASPNKRSLLSAMRTVRKGLERLPISVEVVHVPRSRNALCDWLAK